MDNNVIELFPRVEESYVEYLQKQNAYLEMELDAIESMTFWQRLVFLFTGY